MTPQFSQITVLHSIIFETSCWEKKVIIAFFTKAKIYTFSTILFIAHIVSNDAPPGVGAIMAVKSFLRHTYFKMTFFGRTFPIFK
jgi:hypothetical protein